MNLSLLKPWIVAEKIKKLLVWQFKLFQEIEPFPDIQKSFQSTYFKYYCYIVICIKYYADWCLIDLMKKIFANRRASISFDDISLMIVRKNGNKDVKRFKYILNMQKMMKIFQALAEWKGNNKKRKINIMISTACIRTIYKILKNIKWYMLQNSILFFYKWSKLSTSLHSLYTYFIDSMQHYISA